MTVKMLPNIVRTPRTAERPFFSTARETAQDSTLTFEARGVLWYLLSKPDDWKVQWADIAKQGGFGRDKAKSILTDLRAAGYIVTEMKHGEHGKFDGKIDRVFETSQKAIEHRSTELPSSGLAGKRRNRRIHITEDTQTTEKDAVASAPVDTSRGKPGSYAALHPEIPMEELDKQSAELMKEGVKPSPLSKRALTEAIVKVREYDPERLTGLLKGRIGKAVKDLHSIKFSADDIPALHQYILKKDFPSFTEATYAAYATEFLAQRTTAAAQTNTSDFGAANWKPDFWDTFDGKVGA
jgi:hypothetical protein